MTGKLIVLLAALAALGGLAPIGVEAQPSPPATFSGSASIDGKPAPDGTAIRAFIGDRDCTQSGAAGTVRQGSMALYRIEVPAESPAPGCGGEGRTVSFTVGGHPAGQAAIWKATLQTLDLTATTGTPAPGATPTPNAPATSANATATTPGTQTPASPAPLTRVGSGTPETAVLNSDSPEIEQPGKTAQLPNVALLGAGVAGILVTVGASWWWQRRRTGRRGEKPR